MAMAQLRSDSLAEYSNVCTPLQDLGFSWIPEARHLVWQTTTFYANIADVWIVVTYVLFTLVLVPFCTTTPWKCKTRFTWCLTFTFVLRTLTLLCTRYPKFPGVNAAYTLSSSAEYPWAAVLILLGVRTTQTDYMFSGHVVGWTLTALFYWRYKLTATGVGTVVGVVFWLFNVTGILLLIAVREHYTADVVVAAAVAGLTYHVYHLALMVDSKKGGFIQWID